jgi:hypothetical protein
MTVTVERIVSDQGSIVIFEGLDEEGLFWIQFAADHRPAQWIADALSHGINPECHVENWQIIGSREN